MEWKGVNKKTLAKFYSDERVRCVVDVFCSLPQKNMRGGPLWVKSMLSGICTTYVKMYMVEILQQQKMQVTNKKFYLLFFEKNPRKCSDILRDFFLNHLFQVGFERKVFIFYFLRKNPRKCSKIHDMFITSSWNVHDMFMTSSRHVHDMFMTCSSYFHNMCQTIHDMFRTCSWHVHDKKQKKMEIQIKRI